MKLLFLLINIFLLTAGLTFSQDFLLRQYRTPDGLKTDMIKSVNRDSLGFIWIGTDNGLVKYDGISFTEYPHATSSQYIKDIVRTKSGRLLVIHDMGVVEIKSTPRKVEFIPLLHGNTILTDKALWYPKIAFEDTFGNLWIAEPQSIVKVDPDFKKWKRFYFEEKDNSVSFVRSFNFVQLNADSLLVSSFQGHYFIYNYNTDRISSLKYGGAKHEIHVLKKIDNQIFAGTNIGLYQVSLSNKSILYSNPIIQELITDIEKIDNKSMIICSENSFNYCMKKKANGYKIEPIESSKLNTNQAFVWDNNVWLSTQKGVALLKKPDFRQIKLDVSTIYSEAITGHPESPYVYLLGKEILWRINKKTEVSERIYSHSGGYLLSGYANEKGIWISDAFDLIYFENGKIKDRISLKDYGRFIFNVMIDKNGKVWLTQEATKGVKCYDPKSKKLTLYDEKMGLDFEVNDIKSSEKGVYIAVNDFKSYLLFKPYGSKYFKNISYDKPALLKNIIAEDIAITDSAIWMATNYGILKHGNDTLIVDHLPGNETGAAIRTVVIDNNYMWYGNQFGLYSCNLKTGNYNFYNEETGLSSNSINDEGILLDSDKLWVGTPFGLSVMDYKTKNSKTPIPFIISMIVNGKSVNLENHDIHVAYNSFIEFNYTSLTYPSSDIQFSYRVPQINRKWSDLSFNGTHEFSGLKMGEYTFELKARKLGNYDWSDVRNFTFEVEPAIFESWIFYVLLFLIVVFFALVTRSITKRFMRKRQLVLEKIVEERTAELEHHKSKLEEMVVERTSDLNMVNKKLKSTNEELYTKNDLVSKQKEELENTLNNLKEAQSKLVESEKMASLGILTAGISHEINNPLNFIMAGYLGLENFMEETTNKELEKIQIHLESIKTGVDRATDIVRGLNQFARDNESYDEECNIEEIIDNCVLMVDKNYLDNIEIKKDFTSEKYLLLGNIGKLHQVFLNLMMNAAQAIKGQGQVLVSTNLNNSELHVSIADTGEGISKEHLRKIMDPFFTTKDPGKGTGLGLSITAKIVSEHNGSIKYISELGKGTTAMVTFPIKYKAN